LHGLGGSRKEKDEKKMKSQTEKQIGSYLLGERIGTGTFCKVKKAQHVTTGEVVAVKIFPRSLIIRRNLQRMVQRELNTMQLLPLHRHLVRLYDIIETTEHIYMIMEYLPGGELFDYVLSRSKLNETQARILFQQIISAVDCCHQAGIVHRDLKLENMMLTSCGDVKLVDFGLAARLRDGNFLSTYCGSLSYCAPEILGNVAYAGPEVDVWSCGIVLFTMLCGYFPFNADNTRDLFTQIKETKLQIPAHVSPAASNLIHKMLVADPLQRITIADIYKDKWFCNAANVQHANSNRHAEPTKPWQVGMIFDGWHPKMIMLKMFAALKAIGFEWKCLSPFKVKCRYPAQLMEERRRIEANDSLKMTITLYQQTTGKYVLDFLLRHSTFIREFLFLTTCTMLIAHIQRPRHKK
jgi:5'-AMP-activated protein kinase catalytic alpha subunit